MMTFCIIDTFLESSSSSADSCAPPQLAWNGRKEVELDESRIRKDYTHVREVKFSGSIGPLGERRLCKIKCIGGQWVGPLCLDQHGTFSILPCRVR